MPVMFYSDNTSIVFSELEVFTDEYGYATVSITHPQQSANGIQNTDIYARLNYPELNNTEAQLQQVTYLLLSLQHRNLLLHLNLIQIMI